MVYLGLDDPALHGAAGAVARFLRVADLLDARQMARQVVDDGDDLPTVALTLMAHVGRSGRRSGM